MEDQQGLLRFLLLLLLGAFYFFKLVISLCFRLFVLTSLGLGQSKEASASQTLKFENICQSKLHTKLHPIRKLQI